jgi:hypothetical protein
VDAADGIRLCVAADELKSMLGGCRVPRDCGAPLVCRRFGRLGEGSLPQSPASEALPTAYFSPLGGTAPRVSPQTRPCHHLTAPHGNRAAHPDIRGKPGLPLLVFANKHDLPSALDASDVSMQMGLQVR